MNDVRDDNFAAKEAKSFENLNFASLTHTSKNSRLCNHTLLVVSCYDRSHDALSVNYIILSSIFVDVVCKCSLQYR